MTDESYLCKDHERNTFNMLKRKNNKLSTKVDSLSPSLKSTSNQSKSTLSIAPKSSLKQKKTMNFRRSERIKQKFIAKRELD